MPYSALSNIHVLTKAAEKKQASSSHATVEEHWESLRLSCEFIAEDSLRPFHLACMGYLLNNIFCCCIPLRHEYSCWELFITAPLFREMCFLLPLHLMLHEDGHVKWSENIFCTSGVGFLGVWTLAIFLLQYASVEDSFWTYCSLKALHMLMCLRAVERMATDFLLDCEPKEGSVLLSPWKCLFQNQNRHDV